MASDDSATDFPELEDYNANHPALLKSIIRVVRNISQGRTNNINSVTLTPNSATTTVTLAVGKLGQNSLIVFMPTTATAATEFGAGTMYVSSRNVLAGTFVITHTNIAATDRTFKYAIIG